MKVITINGNNMNYVFGRLKKFFINNHETGFENWHNFDCGFKKHIPRDILINGEKVSTGITYPQPQKLSIYESYKEGKGVTFDYIVVHLTATDSFSIHPGDKIAFMGNRIIIRQKWVLRDNKYVYDVYQVKPMRWEDQLRAHEFAEMENRAFVDDFD